MYQISITANRTNYTPDWVNTSKREVRFSFPTKREAKAYIKKQAIRKGMNLHYGIAYNHTIEISPLF